MNESEREANERKALLDKKRQQMKELRREIEELQAPRSISWMMENQIREVNWKGEVRPVPFSNSEAWLKIRALALQLFKPKHQKEYMKVTTLTGAEAKTAAKMAGEIIEIWNKYVEEIYEKEKE